MILMMILMMTQNQNVAGCLTHTPRIPVAVSVAVILPGKLIFNLILKGSFWKKKNHLRLEIAWWWNLSLLGERALYVRERRRRRSEEVEKIITAIVIIFFLFIFTVIAIIFFFVFTVIVIIFFFIFTVIVIILIVNIIVGQIWSIRVWSSITNTIKRV